MNIIATDLMCEEPTVLAAPLTDTLYASGAKLLDSPCEDLLPMLADLQELTCRALSPLLARVI